MINEQLQNIIEKYLLGEMSPEESARLEADMKNNRELFEEVEIQRLGLIGIQQFATADLPVKLAKWDKELDSQPLSPLSMYLHRTKYNVWVLSTLALFLVVIALLFWHFQQFKKMRVKEEKEERQIIQLDSLIEDLKSGNQQKQNELFALLSKSQAIEGSLKTLEINLKKEELDRMDKFQQINNNKQKSTDQQMALAFAPSREYAMRGMENDDNLDPAIKSVYKALKARKYLNAVYLLKNISPDDVDGQRVVTYELPYALFYAGKFGEAVLAFQELKKTERSEAEKVEFYILLCYVGEGRTAFIQKMITEILNKPQHKFYENTKKLQSVLERK